MHFYSFTDIGKLLALTKEDELNITLYHLPTLLSAVHTAFARPTPTLTMQMLTYPTGSCPARRYRHGDIYFEAHPRVTFK